MKLLLDENLPRRLKRDFPEHDVFTVREKDWNGIKNGELIKLMISEGFDALITFDKNIQHQQNFIKYPISVILLIAVNNQYKQLLPLVEPVKLHLKNLSPGVTVVE